MGGILGGGGGGGGLLGGGGGGGGGFLGNLLGGLPDPLGLGKALGLTGGPDKGAMQGAPPPGGPPMPAGVNFAPQGGSGVSYNPGSATASPMGPTGFKVGGGR